ncbi:MAG: S41 family peptidase [Crocinitomicaceae bacterium]|nr:S41 family peptidase [Crocinitomicaceae bacterium]
MKTTLVLIVTLISLKGFGQEVKLSREQILDDLNLLELELQKHHPNLYVYSSRSQIESSFNELRNSLPDSLDKTQCYNVVSFTSSIVKDGHYNVTPSKQTIDQFYATSRLLPLDIFWTENSAYITKNYSVNNVEIGAQLLSINGIDVNVIRETILSRVFRDGNNTTYPYWILNNFFRAYYNFCFGTSDSYEIALKEDFKKIQTVHLSGLTHKEISEARKVKYPEYSLRIGQEKGIDLKLDKTKATLTIRSFENKLLKENYNQKFRRSIKAHFQTILESGVENLIIDIRGNQGGELTNGLFLLKYVMAEQFQAVQKFTKVDKRFYDSTTKRNKPVRGGVGGFHTPFKDNYKRNLFLLVNGGSFSCSGIVSQVLKKTNRSVIIGTETGGSAYTVVGVPNKDIILPNSQIQITIPLREFILQGYEKKIKGGVIPDIIIEPDISDILSDQDTEYNYALKLIKSK